MSNIFDNLKIRYSMQYDKKAIIGLLESNKYSTMKVLTGLDKRYLLAFDGDELVGMSGLSMDSIEFPGWEVDYTFVKKNYRNNGIATYLLQQSMKYVRDIVCCNYTNDVFDGECCDQMQRVAIKAGLIHKRYGCNGVMQRDSISDSNIKGYSYRYSRTVDKSEIIKLLTEGFGAGTVEYVRVSRGRFILCLYNSEIVGLSGLEFSRLNQAMTLDWTCVKDGHRGNGIATKLIEIATEFMPGTICCDAWRTEMSEGSLAHLHTPLTRNGFVLSKRNVYDPGSTGGCNTCPYKKDNCRCTADLYKLNK